MPRVELRDYRKARTPFGSLMRLFRYFKHCRLILITALDQKRMAEVNVECYPKEQLNEVSAPFWRNMTTPRCCICRRPPLRCRW